MINYNNIINKYKTPLFVYDIDSLHDRVSYLKSKFNKNFNMVYAVKANTFVVKEIDKDVDRFEICSYGEFNICNDLGIDHKKMVISGVNKDFIENLISKYDDIFKYTIESFTQYELLKELCNKYKRHINVLIRLTSGNQFGVNEEVLKSIIKDNNSLITIDGIEYFAGTQKHSLKIIEKDINHLIELIDDIENNLGFTIKEIEYGPGLPVFYFQGEDFNEDEYLLELNKLIEQFSNKVVSLEIGRSMVASCGSYLTSVVDMKSNKTGNYVIVDGGINHLVYYGSTLAMKTPVFEILNNSNKELVNYNIYGSLCTTNDVLIKNVDINELSIGDVFIFKKVGAYSSTEGISLFLSRDLPKIVLYKSGKTKLVRDIICTSGINCPEYGKEK